MPEKILLVDDDLDTLRLVGLMLERQGYEIRATKDGLQALAIAEAELPDIILLDIMMPEMDGYEVTRRLRGNPVTTDIPIILFTAKSQVDDKVMGYEAGADAFLTKPTQPRELFAQMKAVLARSSKVRTTSIPLRERGIMIGVLAPRGGLGVSTVALNLGVALAENHKNGVVVAEFRPGQGTIGLELGFLKADGLNRLLQRKPTELTAREIEPELVDHPSGVRLLLASHQPRDARLSAFTANFEAIARQLPYLASYVILDLGPSLPPVSEKMLTCCDEFIVVVEPAAQTLLQGKTLLEDLFANGVGQGRISTILVNRIRSGMQLNLSQVQDQLGQPVANVITPAPELAYLAASNNVPLIVQQSDSLTAQQFARLAERIAQRKRG
jgi:pilus assembly protein CpaE